MYSEKERKEIIQKYADEMEIIKYRTHEIFTAKKRFDYLEPAIEYKALQLRKIIEQIILASLIANADEYKKYYNRLGSEWNARLICRDLERVNPDFFPKAVKNMPDVIDNKPDGISCQEILTIYDKLGKHLHSKNPFDTQPRDLEALSNFIDDSMNRIIYTLNTHNVTLIGNEAFLNVVMKSTKDGHVGISWFIKCSEDEQ